MQLGSESLNKLISQAAVIIKEGGVVAFPTETYYGLAVDPFNPEALQRLFQVKKRSFDKPILTLIENVGQLSQLARETPALYHPLIEEFWPGPLTLLFPALERLPSLLTACTGDVGARISSHPVARALVRACGFPVTATSANISGYPAVCCAADIRHQLSDIDLLIPFDHLATGRESTIMTCRNGRPLIVRPGAIPTDLILKILATRGEGR
ncbi:MAG: L-threonylcarbamoyladenylate synthase [Thermodesulfobacteriota bacterium]|nr:L-threonylcarbamoyladenylate synthase [Thermodesulfobacteriota bacterium]